MRTPTVGVVTVTYNSAGVLDDFLVSLGGQLGVDVRLYAVDNASIDGTLAKLRAFDHGAVWILENVDNVGIAVGNNQGIVKAMQDECDWILLLNNDTFFKETAIRDLVSIAERETIGILAPTIEATEPTGSIWYAGGRMSAHRGMQVKHSDMGGPMSIAGAGLRETAYASTCVLLLRPEVFNAVGLMDPVYFVYGDDVDFCIRAKAAGWPYWITGGVFFSHKASSLTGEYTAPFAVRWISRNWVVVARRHCSAWELTFANIYMFAWAIARVATKRDSFVGFRSRLRAFAEGRHVDLTSPPPNIDDWSRYSPTPPSWYAPSTAKSKD